MRGTGEMGREVTAKVELEMNLLSRQAAQKSPVGVGRKNPNMVWMKKRIKKSCKAL